MNIKSLLLVTLLGMAGCAGLPELVWPEVTLVDEMPGPVSVGAAAVSITPESSVFLAGGIPYRPMVGVHDDLWARAIVIDNGLHRVALVSLDLIGLYYDDVVLIRQAVSERTDIDYVLVACTHTHNGPDVLGAWSGSPGCRRDAYRQQLPVWVAEAVAQAVEVARPAVLRIAAGDSGDPPLSRDSRPPRLIDDTLTVWQARDLATDAVIVTAVHYASHPILVPSYIFEVSSDFPHYLRQALESGIISDDLVVEPEGGLCVFFNAALGGRITPAAAAPLNGGPGAEPSYELTQGYGALLAARAQQLLHDQGLDFDQPLPMTVRTRPVRVPVANFILEAGLRTCVLERAYPAGQVNSEVGILRIGPMSLFAVPGMMFPELVIGGAEPIPGSDFPDAAVESPVLLEMTAADYPVVVGLGNDMLGYLIPKVLWDSQSPFTSDDGQAPYGEIISTGPDAAGVVMDAFAGLATE